MTMTRMQAGGVNFRSLPYQSWYGLFPDPIRRDLAPSHRVAAPAGPTSHRQTYCLTGRGMFAHDADMDSYSDSPRRRIRRSFFLQAEVVDRARDASVAGNLPIAELVETGLELAMDRLRGRMGIKDFPHHEGPLPKGRPAHRDRRQKGVRDDLIP